MRSMSYSSAPLLFTSAIRSLVHTQRRVHRRRHVLLQRKYLSFGNGNHDGQVIAAEIKKTGIDLLQGESKAYMDKALLLALFKKLQGANRKIEELLR